MFGRVLCWVGIHDWAYRESGCTFHLTRKYVRETKQTGAYSLYCCLRCGIRP